MASKNSSIRLKTHLEDRYLVILLNVSMNWINIRCKEHLPPVGISLPTIRAKPSSSGFFYSEQLLPGPDPYNNLIGLIQSFLIYEWKLSDPNIAR